MNLSRDRVDVWCFDIRHERKALDQAWSCLSAPDQRDAAKYVHDWHRNDFILRRAFLRGVLGSYLGVRPSLLPISISPFGKPGLEAPFSAVSFNLSHSGSIAVCAVTEEVPVGVDVEAIRPMGDALAIAEAYFHQGEVEELRMIESSARERAFLDCWVRKEAYVKALGQGFNIPLNRFRVPVGGRRPNRLLERFSGDDEDWEFHALASYGAYAGALACRGEGQEIAFIRFEGFGIYLERA